MLQYTEENEIPGLLLLTDFEKAFDSVSWEFLYSVLKFFNFGQSIIHWVKVFYNNIKSAIIQDGNMSNFFHNTTRMSTFQSAFIVPFHFVC
jgi:hypothetical protein